MLQNDNQLLIYSQLISPLIRALVNLRQGNSGVVDLEDQMTGERAGGKGSSSKSMSRSRRENEKGM